MSVDDRRSGTWATEVAGVPPTLAVRRCRLVVTDGPDRGREVVVESPRIGVGAQPGNDLVLTDRLVSGHHLEIALVAGGYRLVDLDSTNGTWLAGHRVEIAYLDPGSAIYLGQSRIQFEPLAEAGTIALSGRDRFGDLVGGSVAMRALYAELERIAASDASVLVGGETGSGKELVADALHRRSPRRDGPFVVVDCGAIPHGLIGSELFGHEKGAFTGATGRHLGAFEQAAGGTLFLDEIGELPLELQANLLGVIERRQVRRLGSTRPIPLDVRLVAATHRELPREVNHGRFRADLYYRLAVVQVRVPPLRERLGDLPLLVDHFLAGRQLPAGTLELLARHDFPGNVRELRNLVERAVVAPAALAELAAPAPVDLAAPGVIEVAVDVGTPFLAARRALVADFERRYLAQLLARHGANVSAAARAAGIDRMTVHKLARRAGIPVGRDRDPDDA